MSARLAPLAAAAAAVLLLLGCGPATVARSEYLRRGNAICAAGAARLARLAVPGPTASGRSLQGRAGYVDAYVAELHQELADLRLMGYPAGDRPRLAALYGIVDQSLDAIDRNPQRFGRGVVGSALAPLARAGLTACRA